MKPIPETFEAIDEYGPFVEGGDDDLLDRLLNLAERVTLVVPDCVGMSMTSAEHGVTFTLVASTADVAVLDAIQYLDDGPCVRSVEVGAALGFDTAAMDEEGWRLFSQTTSARGVASTLSIPVMIDHVVVGGFNLYGGSGHSFDGHHDRLAQILGAWAGGAVTNADLQFRSRQVAEQAPTLLKESTRVTVALNMLTHILDISDDQAEARLSAAAVRAGVPLATLVDLVIDVLRRQ